jgi:iron complex outermembrane recepter protein
MKGHSRRVTGTEAVLLSGLGLICATHASAQTATQASSQTSPLAEVVVTGTLIPTNPDAVAVPVTSVDASTLKGTGVSSDMLATLQKTVPAFAGRSNAGSSNAQNHNQFTAGGSQVELRNLPTLVLVNGERLAVDAVAGVGSSKVFVDVSQIPAAALERVDVLTDGASSLYGADAVGGVVNFILKQNYHGLTFGAHYGTADGGYRDRSAFVTMGGDVGPFNITATLNYVKTSPLWANTRDFTSSPVTAGTALPGVVDGGNYMLAPGLTSPGVVAAAGSFAGLPGIYDPTSASALSNQFDFSKYSMLLQQEEHKNFVADITSKPLFGGDTSFFGDILITQNKVQSTAWQASNQPFANASLTVPAGSPYNPLTTDAMQVTFADMANPKGVYDTTDDYRVSLGLKGSLTHSWTWQSSADYSQSKLTERDTNLIFGPNLSAAIAGGYDANGNAAAGGAYSEVYGNYTKNGAMVLQPALDPFALTNPAAALANVLGTEVLHGDSKLYSWDAHAVGDLFKLPAGSLSLAAGVNWRREELSGYTGSGPSDPNGRVTDPTLGSVSCGLATSNCANWVGGVYADPFSHSHSVSAVYAETRVPLTSSRMNIPGLNQFELTLADRFEHYSDAGNGNSPKFGFRWAPFDNQFVMHATYTKAFSAPQPYQAYGPYDTRPVTDRLIGIVFGPGYNLGGSFNGEDGVNPNLKPSTSVSRSIGFTFRPHFISGLAVNADFSSVDVFGFQGGADFTGVLASVNALGSASPYFDSVSTGQFTNLGGSDPFGTPGSLAAYLTKAGSPGVGDPAKISNLYVIDRFRNESTLIERSWTLGAMYILPWSQYGTWTVSTNAMAFDSFKFQRRPGDMYQQYAGNASNIGVFAGTLPKYRFYTTVDWAYKSLEITLANTYISSVMDAGAAGNGPLVEVPRYSSFDLRGAYTWYFGSEDSGKKAVLALGVNDLNNAAPPYFPKAFSNAYLTTDIGTYSPIEREVYGDVTVSF